MFVWHETHSKPLAMLEIRVSVLGMCPNTFVQVFDTQMFFENASKPVAVPASEACLQQAFA